jgi:hypothetical protein
MAGVAEVIELDRTVRHLERCRMCDTALPVPPAPRVCAKCGAIRVTPHHSEWSREMKVFLLLQYVARNLFTENLRSVQNTWELLLTSQYERRFVGGRLRRQGVDPDEVFALAVKEAEEWRLAGAVTAFL